MSSVSDFLKRASQRNGYERERYKESNIPTDFNDVCIFPFFGDYRSSFLLSSFLLHKYKNLYASSKYFIMCGWPGFASIFPYVDEYWGFNDYAQLSKVYEKSDGFYNTSDIATIYTRNLHEFFRNVIDIKDVCNLYNQGFKKEFTCKSIETFLPFVPSSSILGKEFTKDVNQSAGFKVLFSPTLYCKQWHNGKSRNFKTNKDFWIELGIKLKKNNFTPIVWQNSLTHDISADLLDNCVFINDKDISKVLAAMRMSGCVLDIFNGLSRYALIARTPFLAVDERSRYNNLKEYECDSLIGDNIPKQYIFTFSTIINNGNVHSWSNDIFPNIVNRLNQFLPEVDRDLLPTTSESWKNVSYKEKVEIKEVIKLGRKLFKINRD